MIKATGLRNSILEDAKNFEHVAEQAAAKVTACNESRKKIETACESIAADLKGAISENSRAEREDAAKTQSNGEGTAYVEIRRKLEAQEKNTRQLETKAVTTLEEVAKCYDSKKQKAEIISQYEADMSDNVGFDRAPGSIGANSVVGASDNAVFGAAKNDAIQSSSIDQLKGVWKEMKPIPTPGTVLGDPATVSLPPSSTASPGATKSFAASAASLLFGAVGDYFGMVSPAGTPCDEAPSDSALDQNAKGCAAYAQSALN